MSLSDRIKQDNEILKKIKREIIKQAKKNEFYYYWDFSGLSDSVVKSITSELEKDGKMVKTKGTCKIIRW